MTRPVRPETTRPPVERGPWWGTPGGAAVIVAALAGVAYARALGNDFTYDEGLVIARAQPFLQSLSLPTLLSRHYFGASLEGTWRPFCTLTYMIDSAISSAPAIFKAANLGWHIAASLLAVALARRLLPERHRRFAIGAGLVLALHPVATETVDNASFREDALVTVFTLATLVLAIDGRRALALCAFALGLLSKESGVLAPALLALARVGRVGAAAPDGARRPTAAALARELVPYAAVAVVYLGLRFGPFRTPMQYATYPGGSFRAALAGLPAIWTHYLRLVLAPWPLCADLTGYFRFGPQPWGRLAVDLLILAAYGALIVWNATRGHRALAFGLAWFPIALLPVSNLLAMPIPAAERFLYLPLAGLGLAAAAAFGLLVDRWSGSSWRWLPSLGAAVVLAAWVVIANLRHGDWRDDEALWRATVATNPRSCGAQSAVGGRLLTEAMAQAATAAQARALLEESVARQKLALSLCTTESDPTRAAMIQTRLGGAEALLDDRPAARAALEQASRLAPRYSLAVAWLGYLASLDGDRDRAAALLKHAIIDLGPPDATVAQVAQLYVDRI